MIAPKHGPQAPQSTSVRHICGHIIPPAGSPKYWIPTPMPVALGCMTKALIALVTAPHLSPPPETGSDIEPD
jgi:hypothetical protein